MPEMFRPYQTTNISKPKTTDRKKHRPAPGLFITFLVPRRMELFAKQILSNYDHSLFMMRTWTRKLLLVSVSNLVLLCKSYAALSGSDNFDDNSVDNSKWGPDFVPNGGFLADPLAETNGRLEYSSNGNGDQETRRPWILNRGDLTSNWEVQLDVTVNAILPSLDQYASFGIDVSNSGDSQDFVFIELFNSTFEPPIHGRGFLSQISNDDALPGTPDLGSASGAVRLTYESITRVLRTYYDASGPIGGYSWTPLGSFGVGSSGGGITGNDDWGMTANDSFIIDVYGFSGSFAVPVGSVYGDNFLAVPEPSLTALLLLGFAGLWIRLRAAPASGRAHVKMAGAPS
jgi:hypothetical protein